MSSATTDVQRPRENCLSVFVLRTIATGAGSLAGGYLGGKGGVIIGTKVREVIVGD